MTNNNTTQHTQELKYENYIIFLNNLQQLKLAYASHFLGGYTVTSLQFPIKNSYMDEHREEHNGP
jgi:hypothetical protein